MLFLLLFWRLLRFSDSTSFVVLHSASITSRVEREGREKENRKQRSEIVNKWKLLHERKIKEFSFLSFAVKLSKQKLKKFSVVSLDLMRKSYPEAIFWVIIMEAWKGFTLKLFILEGHWRNIRLFLFRNFY